MPCARLAVVAALVGMSGFFSGCATAAPVPQSVDAATIAATSNTVIVRCSIARQEGAPCEAEARERCKGPATVSGINSAVEIPMPVGTNQSKGSRWDYQARYRCGA